MSNHGWYINRGQIAAAVGDVIVSVIAEGKGKFVARISWLVARDSPLVAGGWWLVAGISPDY